MNDAANGDREKWLTLALALLAPLRRAGEIPRLSKADRNEIVKTAWAEMIAEFPEAELEETFHARYLKPGLDATVGAEPFAESETEPADVGVALGEWLENFLAKCRSLHPRAVEIVGLHLEGFDERTISEGLHCGLRLVHRILADIRRAGGSIESSAEELPC